MDEPYAVICGISEDEIRLQMKDDLEGLAKKLGITPEEALMKLKENYHVLCGYVDFFAQ